MAARISFCVLVAFCLLQVVAGGPQCAYVSDSDQVYDLRPLTGTGPNNGDFLAQDTNGNTFYWNPCGINKADTMFGTGSLTETSSSGALTFRGELSETAFTEETVGDVTVSYVNGIRVSRVHLECSVGATSSLAFVSLVNGVLDLTFTYDCCAEGQSFVSNKCRGTNEANVCNTQIANACNSNGKCLGSEAFGTCSCYSGYSGPLCANLPDDSSFLPALPESNSAIFDASITLDLTSRAGVIITLPSQLSKNGANETENYSEETTLTFQGSDPNCNYPANPNWIITQEKKGDVWYDVYYNVFSYQQLIGCGFNRVAADLSPGFETYQNTLDVYRRIILVAESFGTQPSERRHPFPISINFPKKLTALTDIYVADNTFASFNGIVSTGYDIPSATWTVVFSASVKAPYMLKQNGDVTTVGTFGDVSSRQIAFSALSTCTSVSGDCTQNFTITAKGCAGLDFSSTLPFSVLCRPGIANCPPASVTSLSPVIRLSLGSTCPIAQNTSFGQVTMGSYYDSGLTKAGSNFGTTGNLYFGVAFTTALTVSAIDVDHACARPSSAQGGGFCGTNSGDQLLSASAVPVVVGSQFQYGFSLAGPDLATQFSVTSTPQQLTVQVDLLVTTDAGKKRATVVRNASATSIIVISTNPESVPSAPTSGLSIGGSSSDATSLTLGFLAILSIALLI